MIEDNKDDKFDQLLTRSLERNDFSLPQGFADRMVAMAEAHSLEKETKRDRVWWIVGIVSMIGALIFVIKYLEFKPSVQFSPRVGVFTFFEGYSGLVIFGILFVVCLHLFDKLILRKQESG